MTTVADRAAVVDVLKRIEARHADSSRWCQRATARSSKGRPVRLFSKVAYSTCLVGALDLEGFNESFEVRQAAFDTIKAARDACGYGDAALTYVNDKIGYEAVRAIERRAIKIAESEARS